MIINKLTIGEIRELMEIFDRLAEEQDDLILELNTAGQYDAADTAGEFKKDYERWSARLKQVLG